MIKILFIHGINNEDLSQNLITNIWKNAFINCLNLEEKKYLQNISFDSCFYGDILAQETSSWGNGIKTERMNENFPNNELQNLDLISFYRTIQKKYKITDNEVDNYLLNNGEALNETMAGGIHKKWLKAISKLILNKTPIRGKLAAKIFLKQAAAYLYKPNLYTRINNIVAKQIERHFHESDDIIIISHSLGTIIMYDLLRSNVSWACKLLLTVGSPLGFREVKKRLGPPLICLKNVERWVNISDPEDFVAFESELNSVNFGCDQITNYSHIDNGIQDAHSIENYLQHDIFKKEIYDVLRMINSTFNDY